MIFKEKKNEINNNILPLIKNNLNEIKKNKFINTKQNSYISNNLTIDINYINNNRYIYQDNNKKEIINDIENIENQNEKEKEKEKEKLIEKENKNKSYTITNSSSRIITNENDMNTAKNPFIAKVELDNIRSRKDCIYLLEDYLRNNNIEFNYDCTFDQDKIIFSFNDEKTALDFSKIIYNEKSRNSLYKNVLVHLRLTPNKKYLKEEKLKNKKRGLSFESIIKLYKGSSYVKKIKEFPKVKGNIQLRIKSPFYNINDKKKNKINNSFKTLKNKKYISRNNNRNIFENIGYDGLPLKSYEKLRISVLDTHYNPFSNFKYREDNKQKWISPSNFKYY